MRLKSVYSFFRHVIRLGGWDYTSRIVSPLRIVGHKNIFLGHHTVVLDNAFLISWPLTGRESSVLSIGDNSNIGYGSHIVATNEVRIGRNVEIAPYVYISDNNHGYQDINIPIQKQPIVQLEVVSIGDGSWIGRGAVIQGCKIGKHCIIGANSVVRKDIPDYSVAVGAPAKVVKRFDFETRLICQKLG